MSDALALAIAMLPGVVALVCGAIRWRLARRARSVMRRAYRRTPISVRIALVSGVLLVGACHSIDEDAFAHAPVPTSTLPFNEPILTTDGVAVGEQNGLLGSYFAGAQYDRLDHQQVDPNIEYFWDASDTNPVVSGPDGIDHNDGDFRLPDHWPIWSIVWEGYLAAPVEGDYSLRLHVNNGGWLEMKDASGGLQVVVNCRGGTSFEGDCDAAVHLTAERHYIRVSYYNNAPSSADAIFSWAPPGAAGFGVVPTEALFTQRTGESAEIAPELLDASFGGDPTVGLLVAEPVNTFSGNLTLSSIDLAVPARGFPLRLARTYNTRDTHVGAFGPSWTSSIEWALSDGGATVRVTHGDGRRDVFTRNADGSYAPPSGVFDTLAKRADGSFALTMRDQTAVEYTAAGAIVRVSDRNGNALAFATDTAGRVIAVSDGAGRSLAIAYDAAGRLVRASDPAGRAVTYTYDAGRLDSFTDAAGATTRYAYDAKGRLASVTDPLGNVTLRNTYDAHDRVVAQTDAVGGVVRFSYDDATHTTTHTDARGNASRIGHDAQGRAVQVTDSANAVVRYGYDARGDLVSFTDRNRNVWRFAYDTSGNRIGVTDPAGGTAAFTYDARNDLLTRVDPNASTWRYSYDGRGNLLTTTDPEGGATAVVVDASGLPVSVTDADGVVTRYMYDAAGLLRASATSAGATSFAYDAAGRLVARTDPNGHATTFAYDAASRLVRTTDPLGNVSSFAYDAAGNLVSVTDRRGATTSLRYDAAGRIVASTDALGGVTAFGYDANGNRTSVSDPSGATMRFTFDARDRLVATADAAGGTALLIYDANGNVVKTIDPRGATATFAYDFRNLRTSARDRTGATTTYAYDPAGRLVATTDPLGATTRLAYDRAGRYTSTTDALGDVTSFAYTAAGRAVSTTDPKGNVTRFSYDGAGRLVTTIDAAGGRLAFAYDAAGNLVARDDQLGRRTAFSYDALDRAAAITNALGGRTAYAYDGEGAVTALTDANGATTTYSYDPLGRLGQVTDALGGSTRYGYDARGLLVRVTDANGHVRTSSYDGNRRLMSETDALGRARSYAYDANGNRVTTLDAKGQRTTASYDAEDRLSRIGYADGSSVSFVRDAAGQRVQMTDPLGVTAYAYDALRRLVAVTDPAGRTVRYGYDAAGLRTSLAYPDGRAATYRYDALDRLIAVGFAGSTHTYAYDAVGNVTAGAFANGTRFDATYDGLDRLTALTNRDRGGKVASAFRYTYDALGNVTSEDESGARDLKDNRTYAYDALSRLVSATDKEHKTARFSYDAVGNRTASVGNDGEDALSGTFDAADELVSLQRQANTIASFQYDANGNLVERAQGDARATFSWDAADRLAALSTPESGGAQRSAAFAYDGDGNLRRETHSGDQVPTTLDYTLDVARALPQVLTASDGTDTAAYLYGLRRIAAFSAGATRYYADDVRGSVRTLTDERGAVTFAQRYDAWGSPHDQGDGSVRLATLFGFAGERQDPKSGLLYLRARWYAPDTGRFASVDAARGTLADPRTQGRYVYAQDNPTSRVDPSGFSASLLFDGGASYAFDALSLYVPFLSANPLGLSAGLPAPVAQPQQNSFLQNAGDFVGGFFGSAVNTVKGVVDVGAGVYRSTVACQFGFIGPLGQMCADQWQANGELAGYIASDPGRFVRQTWDAATANCRNAIVQDSWSAAGGCTFDIASAVVGLKGLGNVTKLTKGATAAEAATTVERTGAAATPSLRIYMTESRFAQIQRTGSLVSRNPEGLVYATDAQYNFGNIAQSNLAISTRGERIAGYVDLSSDQASRFVYSGRVRPIQLWEGGGREFTAPGAIPAGDLGSFRRIPWAPNVQ